MRAKLLKSASFHPYPPSFGYCTYNFTRAIDRPTVHALRFIGRILNLQSRFDVFYRCRNEADCCSGQNACNSMTKAGQCVPVLVFGKGCYAANLRPGEDVLEQQSAIQRQGTKHAILRVSSSFLVNWSRARTKLTQSPSPSIRPAVALLPCIVHSHPLSALSVARNLAVP